MLFFLSGPHVLACQMYLRRMKSLAFLSEAAFGQRPSWTDDVISYCLMLCPLPFRERTADEPMWHCEGVLVGWSIERATLWLWGRYRQLAPLTLSAPAGHQRPARCLHVWGFTMNQFHLNTQRHKQTCDLYYTAHGTITVIHCTLLNYISLYLELLDIFFFIVFVLFV